MERIECSTRIRNLRAEYLNNSILVNNSDSLSFMMEGNAIIQYVYGWKNAPYNNITTKKRRSVAEAYMLEHLNPVISRGELIVGQPDLNIKDKDEYNRCREFMDIMPVKAGRESHMGLDYKILLDKGVKGIIADIESNLSQLNKSCVKDMEKIEFYEGCLIELNALLVLAEHYSHYARELGMNETGKQREEYFEIADILERVPAYPAKTFREALQSIHFYTFNLFGLYSAGRPDEYLYPYYVRDIESGVMTKEFAQELIDCFCLLYIPNVISWAAAGFMLGGRDKDGNSVENDLTWMFLNSISHVHAPDPNVGLCITDETSEDIIRFAAELIAEGHSGPVIWNDEEVTQRMLENDFDLTDACQYTHSTCSEITPIGCSGMSCTSPYVNTLSVFLDAFYAFDDDMTFEQLKAVFKAKLKKKLKQLVYIENIYLMENSRNGMINPLRTSCLVNDCIKSGKSIEQGGAKYNHLAADFLGMMNVAECFNVIYRLVYEEKRVKLSYLQKCVKNNYENDTMLLEYIRNKITHYGNNDEISDNIAKEIADIVCESCKDIKSYKGGNLLPGAFSYNYHVKYGKLTNASPDGRKNGEPLHDGSGAVQGYDINGPTASLLSLSAYKPSRFLGGISFNVKLSKNLNSLTDVIISLIKGQIAIGNPQMQISIVDNEELRRAQKDPTKYKNLLVRIGGYSDFFVKLDRNLQDEIISRSE